MMYVHPEENESDLSLYSEELCLTPILVLNDHVWLSGVKIQELNIYLALIGLFC